MKNNNNDPLSLESMPEEIKIKVLSYLDKRELAFFGEVSKTFHRLSNDERLKNHAAWPKLDYSKLIEKKSRYQRDLDLVKLTQMIEERNLQQLEQELKEYLKRGNAEEDLIQLYLETDPQENVLFGNRVAAIIKKLCPHIDLPGRQDVLYLLPELVDKAEFEVLEISKEKFSCVKFTEKQDAKYFVDILFMLDIADPHIPEISRYFEIEKSNNTVESYRFTLSLDELRKMQKKQNEVLQEKKALQEIMETYQESAQVSNVRTSGKEKSSSSRFSFAKVKKFLFRVVAENNTNTNNNNCRTIHLRSSPK